jgi:hypothetical protein
MNGWVKNILTSTVVTSLVLPGLVGWFVASYKIEQELHSKQNASSYEALIEANAKAWQAKALEERNGDKNEALAVEIEKLKRESDVLYVRARSKIAAFGDERVVKAMSDFYKFRSLVLSQS